MYWGKACFGVSRIRGISLLGKSGTGQYEQREYGFHSDSFCFKYIVKNTAFVAVNITHAITTQTSTGQVIIDNNTPKAIPLQQGAMYWIYCDSGVVLIRTVSLRLSLGSLACGPFAGR